MWGVFDKAVELLRPSMDARKSVYRDELIKKPLIQRKKKNDQKEREVTMRVKILMTKEEAERLLSKCKDGGKLDFKDAVHELMKIPANRVSVVDPQTCSPDGVLKSIPEEC